MILSGRSYCAGVCVNVNQDMILPGLAVCRGSQEAFLWHVILPCLLVYVARSNSLVVVYDKAALAKEGY